MKWMDESKLLIANDEVRKGSSCCLTELFGRMDGRIESYHRLHRITLTMTGRRWGGRYLSTPSETDKQEGKERGGRAENRSRQ